MTNILIKPIITEKSMQDAASHRYTFAVAISANKAEIAKEVVKSFGVKVLKVKTSVIKGKMRRAGKMRREIQTASWKKATVEVRPEDKIALFDVTEQEHQHQHA